MRRKNISYPMWQCRTVNLKIKQSRSCCYLGSHVLWLQRATYKLQPTLTFMMS